MAQPKYSHLGQLHASIIKYSDVIANSPVQINNSVPLQWFDNCTSERDWRDLEGERFRMCGHRLAFNGVNRPPPSHSPLPAHTPNLRLPCPSSVPPPLSCTRPPAQPPLVGSVLLPPRHLRHRALATRPPPLVFPPRPATNKFTNGTQQYAYVYSNSTTSVAFIENDAPQYILVLFNGVQLNLSPNSVLVYDVHSQTPVYDTYTVLPAATHREFQQVCACGEERVGRWPPACA